MTATENGAALAVRTFTDTQLQTRIKANINARYGLQDASPAQLNTIFLLAKRWQLDPINELTLYEGQPFITLDGRLQLMRRNPDYRGYRTRPLKREEREDWGYEPDDVVVECTVLTHTHGDITERGCVRRAEIDGARARAKASGKRAAPVGIYVPEIAEKRAIARASRAAFGQDVPDEDEVGYVIEERNAPAKVALDAARYTEIMGTEDESYHLGAMPAAETSAVQPPAPARAPDPSQSGARGPAEAMVTSKRSPLWAAWTAASAQADAEGLDVPELTLPVAEDALRASTASLVEMMAQW